MKNIRSRFHLHNCEIEEIRKIICNVEDIIILTHFNPDGDSIGSTSAMYSFCKRLQKSKKTNIKNIDYCGIHDIPCSFSMLKGIENYSIIEKLPEYYFNNEKALIISLDSATPERSIPNYAEDKDKLCKILIIDHHVSNTHYGFCNVVKSAASCSEIVSEVIIGISKMMKLNQELTEDEAYSLYTGMKTDTGNFTYSYVDSKTLYHGYSISKYLEPGAISEIDERLQKNKATDFINVVSKVLSTVKYFKDNKVCILTCKKEFYQSSNVTLDCLKNLVNYPFQVIPVKLCILITETDDSFNLSIRSKDPIKAKPIAEYFGGGGHENAAGAIIKNKSYSEIIETLKGVI